MIFLTLLFSTIKEAFEKKIILFIFFFITLIVVLMLVFINLDSVEGMKEMFMMSGENDYRDVIIRFETTLINQLSFIVIFCLLIVMSASFIPSMLEKGTIDLILSKPVSRTKLILSKFLSIVLLSFLIIAFLILIIWIIISVKSNIWYFPFLSSILWLTYIFAILYSLELLIGLITQSTVMSLLITLFVLFPLTALLSVRESMVFSFVKSDSIQFIFNFLYYIFPKPWDLRESCIAMIEGIQIQSWIPAVSSGIFFLVMLSLSVYYFSRKDY